MEEVLVYFSVIHNGDWNKIYQEILKKTPVEKEQLKAVMDNVKDSYITLINNNYPECLKSIFKPPFVLYYKGDLSLLTSKEKRVAVIGSRDNSPYGRVNAEKISKELVENNVIIVSGLARGIDSIAHQTCLNNNGKTIGVLGNGLDISYPEKNDVLYKDVAKNGLLLSEYPFNVSPDASHFKERNRIISAISEGIVVVEAAIKSGTMNTVSHALENGKQIFCIPERVNENSGCNKLIKEGAKLVENAKDILEEL